MGKRVLILGNGFDLAHGLPTRYSHFLEFCRAASIIYTCSEYVSLSDYVRKVLNTCEMNDYIKYILSDAFENKTYRITHEGSSHDKETITPNKALDKLYTKIKENIWYNYFQKIYTDEQMKGENWIDFESEISYIIKTIDENTKNITYSYTRIYSEFDDEKIEFPDKIKTFSSMLNRGSSVREIRKVLYNDLEKLTQALEIYLKFVEGIPIKIKSNEIVTNYKKTIRFEQSNTTILHCNFDYVINFNYTHTYKNVYNILDKIFYIHGETNHDPNNMVLGIDEYWSEKERDSHTNFTIFKKFAQRIQKRTGVENYKWFKEIYNIYQISSTDISEIYIFGHSLDITDRDILYDYLESEATSVTIYCKDKETEGEYIANVIKIIGEKRLIEKVNHYPPKLRFVIQQPMVPIEEKEKELSTSGAAT